MKKPLNRMKRLLNSLRYLLYRTLMVGEYTMTSNFVSITKNYTKEQTERRVQRIKRFLKMFYPENKLKSKISTFGFEIIENDDELLDSLVPLIDQELVYICSSIATIQEREYGLLNQAFLDLILTNHWPTRKKIIIYINAIEHSLKKININYALYYKNDFGEHFYGEPDPCAENDIPLIMS